VLFPLVTHVNGNTVGIGDDFKIGFKYAFDLEFVPVLDPRQNGPLNVSPGCSCGNRLLTAPVPTH